MSQVNGLPAVNSTAASIPPPQPGQQRSPRTGKQSRTARPVAGSAGTWLRWAAAGLGLLASAAAAVSFTAQYELIFKARHLAVIAGLEAAIPDAAALVFACLGLALAMHGRRAVHARVLNTASAGASVFMNVIAAAPGWRDQAVWVMPPAAYALASDTLISVVRTSAIARNQELDAGLAGREATALTVIGGLMLWLLRLCMSPTSTMAGFRAWVLEECPVAPGRRAARPATLTTATTAPAPALRERNPQRSRTKTARFLVVVAERHGPLARVPLDQVSKISAALAPEVELNAGAARAALRRAVLAAQNGGTR